MSGSFMDEMADFIGEGIHKTLRVRGSRDSVAAWDCINKMGSDWGHIIDELTPMFVAKTIKHERKKMAEWLGGICPHDPELVCDECAVCHDNGVALLREGKAPWGEK